MLVISLLVMCLELVEYQYGFMSRIIAFKSATHRFLPIFKPFSQTLNTFTSMSKQKKLKKRNDISGDNLPEESSSQQNYVILDKSNNLLIHILAKPAAKQNKITDVTTEGLGIQINAPPTEGEANMELIKYLSSVLGIRKTYISLERGSKSRQKVLKISESVITLNELKEKIAKEIEDGKNS